MKAEKFKDITSHRKALELAELTLLDKLDKLGQKRLLEISPQGEERAKQILQNYEDAASIIRDLINEEIRAGY